MHKTRIYIDGIPGLPLVARNDCQVIKIFQLLSDLILSFWLKVEKTSSVNPSLYNDVQTIAKPVVYEIIFSGMNPHWASPCK